MSRADLKISDDARARQQKAANPADWIWVTANAGSGKTHVLAERVMRLLLEGVEPSRILCLTYTKTAAANMRERVFKGLSEFAVATDEQLRNLLEKLGATHGSPGNLEKARRLFAEALETPGGLKIQTIHAFCEMVLRRFPLEANIAGHFELLQGQAEKILIAEARRQLITKATGSSAGLELAAAFNRVFADAGEDGLEKLVSAAIGMRGELAGYIPRAIGESRNWQPLYQSLGFGPEETEETIAQSVWPAGGMDDAKATAISAIGKQVGGVRFQDNFSDPFASAMREKNLISRVEYYRQIFLDSKGQPRDPEWIIGNPINKIDASIRPLFAETSFHVLQALNRLADFRLIRRSTAALLIAETLIGEYEAIKQQRGLLDFADLISRTQRLLTRPDVSAWVRYKLDSGIDHILLDEAQDTSPGQWDVLTALTEEIFDNQEGSNRKRTVFVVGDPKQSIYSFQGARPDSFDNQRYAYQTRAKVTGLGLKSIEFQASFRSAPVILDGVDKVFAQADLRKGVTVDGRGTSHESLRPNAQGRIDVWDLELAQKAEVPQEWADQQDVAQSPLVRVARDVAKTIARWTNQGFAKPGEILILVRKRNGFIHALARELKNLNVPVGGVDRLNLLSHIAIKDLLALARICVAPADSLSLASLLKSPVFSFTEDELMELALAADGKPLMDTLSKQTSPKFCAAFEQIGQWRKRADTIPLDHFFALALGADGLRSKFIARFGAEVSDILDEFLAVAHESTRNDNPGLDAFIEALEAAPPEIKRQMDQNRDEVRILTVHGAKGLEAPHVFLVDGGGAISSPNQRPVLGLFSGAGAPLYGRDCYLWTVTSENSPLKKSIIERFTSLAEDEYRRLLYVAMTRAETTLTICGWRTTGDQSEKAKPGWAEWVKAGLFGAEGSKVYTSPEGVKMWRFEPKGPMPETVSVDNGSVKALDPFEFSVLPPEPQIPRPLAPSAAALIIEAGSEDELEELRVPGPLISPVLGNKQVTSATLLRGTLVHTLLQRLPDLPHDQRLAAAARFIALHAASLSLSEQAAIVAEAAQVISNPAFAVLFAAGSKAEVQVSGTLKIGGKDQIIAGKIDRICQANGVVTLIDFKTGRVPAKAGEISQAYIMQLALYRQLVKPIFPGHEVNAALVYTSQPKLIYAAQAAMDEALVSLGVETA